MERHSMLTRRDSPYDEAPRQSATGSPLTGPRQADRSLLVRAAPVSGAQGEFEDHLHEALQAMHAAQVAAFKQVRAQFSQIAGENLVLREQLGQGAAFPKPPAKPPARPPHPEAMQPMSLASEAFHKPPQAFNTQAFTKSPQSSRDIWRPEPPDVSFGEAALPGQLMEAENLASKPLRRGALSVPTIDDKQQLQLQGARAREMQQRRRLTNFVHNNKRIESEAASPEGFADTTAVPAKRTSKSRLFPDKTDLMEKVQMSLFKPEYKVTNYYHTHGVSQLIARSPVFETVTLAVIVLNSIWIAIDTDHNTEPLDPPTVFVVIENLFCGFFFLELLVRFLSFESKWNCRRDPWFVFDFILVSVAVLETWVMVVVGLLTGVTMASLTGRSSAMLRLLRMARLARTARMARLLRSVPAIMIMFKGMLVASHAVICTIFLLTIIIYVFALCLRQLTFDSTIGQTHFRSVPASMGTLLLMGALPDAGGFVYDLSDSHLLLGSIGLVFVLLTVLVVLNVLAGVLVNVVQIVADLEKEEADAAFVRNSLPSILDLGDVDGDKKISKAEFDELIQNPQAIHLLEQVNVDIMGLVELSDFIFMNSKEYLDFEDFFKLLLKLRGSNTATVKDIVEMRKFIIQEIGSLEHYIGGMLRQVLDANNHHNRDLH